jgi:DNA-binding response OmpR family regulator
MRVLIVEDDASLGELLARVVREEGGSATWCVDATSGLRAADQEHDVIVLDWMLPDGSGPAFCEQLRRSSNATPVLMLTARGEVADRVTGLRSGADDYLVKPFEIDELLARLDALIRRNKRLVELHRGAMVIDRLHRRCTLHGVELDLTAREYELLLRLAVAEGEPVSRTMLLRDVWKTNFDAGSGVLDVHISRLRDKLGANAGCIETVRGVGYRLIGDV